MIYMGNFAKIDGGGPQAGMGLIALIFAIGGIGFLINLVLTNIGAWGYYSFFVK